MKVQDLVYLLTTRCKPEDEVNFTSIVETKKGLVEFNGCSEDTFDEVFRECFPDDDGVDGDLCNIANIRLGDHFVKGIMADVYQGKLKPEDFLSDHHMQVIKAEKVLQEDEQEYEASRFEESVKVGSTVYVINTSMCVKVVEISPNRSWIRVEEYSDLIKRSDVKIFANEGTK